MFALDLLRIPLAGVVLGGVEVTRANMARTSWLIVMFGELV